jgi:hypothetical protein
MAISRRIVAGTRGALQGIPSLRFALAISGNLMEATSLRIHGSNLLASIFLIYSSMKLEDALLSPLPRSAAWFFFIS